MRYNVRQNGQSVQTDSLEWFYRAGDEQIGPVGLSELRLLLSTGKLDPDSLVWRPSMPQWQPASSALAPFVSTAETRLANYATSSLVLGLISVFGLFVFITLPAALAGLVLGIRARSSSRRGQAIAGILLSSLGLIILVWLAVSLGRAIAVLGWEQFMVEFFGGSV